MATSIKVGDKVTTTAEYDVNGIHLASFVRNSTFDVIQVGGTNLPDNRVVIGRNGQVTAAVDIKTLTVKSSQAKPTPKPTEIIEEKKTPFADMMHKDLVAAKVLPATTTTNTTTSNNPVTAISSGGGSSNSNTVQYLSEKYTATKTDGWEYTPAPAQEQLNSSWLSAEENKSLNRLDPKWVQNGQNFPPVKKFDTNVGYYRYNYEMNYNTDTIGGQVIGDDFNKMRKVSNLELTDRLHVQRYYSSYYNKFKLDNPNDHLTKSFAHVFFVRPDCNIYAENSSGWAPSPVLVKDLENLAEFKYAKKHAPHVLRQLTQYKAGYEHQFMMLPSNKARTFEIADEYITSDTYGESLTGHKIAYGKTNIESKTAGKFSITYIDDRDLRIYNLHKLWIDYISYIYRGKIWPQEYYIRQKNIDYATCVYYFLCAEDGESIIFWSKYWGVFPLEAPSSSFSYSAENGGGVKNPELKIEYQYSWKEDFNPLAIIEFNTHSKKGDYQYVHNYQTSSLGTGWTWAGAPFIETCNGTGTLPYTFKLRFRPFPNT